MDRAVLLTLGRLPKGLELARCLHAAGCRVYVAEPFGWHLSKPSRAVERSFRVTAPNRDGGRFAEEMLAIIDSERIDLVVPVSEEALHVSLLQPHLPSRVTLLSPPFSQLLQLHHKLTFNEAAKEAGLIVPRTSRASEPEADAIVAASDHVIKPALGCSGAGLKLVPRGTPLAPHDRDPSLVVQERKYGREISSLTLARNGRNLGTVLYEGLVFSGTVATCFRRVDDTPQALAWIERFVAQQNYSGFIAFDFIVDSDGGVWPIECNPRLTSGIHFMDHGDLAACLLGAAPAHHIRMKAESSFQEGHTTLAEAYAKILEPREFLRRLKCLFGARDVLWSLRDPLPFLLMTPMSWDVLRQVFFQGASLGEAATRDIAWLSPAPAQEGQESSVAGCESARGQKDVITREAVL